MISRVGRCHYIDATGAFLSSGGGLYGSVQSSVNIFAMNPGWILIYHAAIKTTNEIVKIYTHLLAFVNSK